MGKKDPNAPKRPLSAYFTWLGENRVQVKADNPGMKHKDVTSKLGTMWNALDDAVKKEYKDKATVEMNKWKLEFQEYKKTPEYAEWEANKEPKKKSKARKKKPPKDPNAPKRPSTGFFLFVSEKRAEVKASLLPEQQNKVTLVTKKCGELWSNSSEETKASFKDRSKKLKEKYDEDLAAYKLTEQYRQHQEVVREFKDKQKAADQRSKGRARPKSRPVMRQMESDSETSSSESS